jgi:hypothetical protein
LAEVAVSRCIVDRPMTGNNALETSKIDNPVASKTGRTLRNREGGHEIRAARIRNRRKIETTVTEVMIDERHDRISFDTA